MPLIFYFHPLSPPSQAVKALLLINEIQFLPELIDLMKGQNLTEEFQKINPNQSVPAIADQDYKLFESNAILKYIAITRKLTTFYPTDAQPKALVDSYLDFHTTSMQILTDFPRSCYIKPYLMKQAPPADIPQKKKEVEDSLTFFVNTFLNGGKFKYINDMKTPSIADIKAIIDISKLFAANFDFDKFPAVKAYIETMYQMPMIFYAQKEFFGLIQRMHPKLTPFITQIISSSQSITLYYHHLSPPSQAVRAFLLMSKIQFQEKLVDLMKGENKLPEYEKINPNQSVPAIVDGDYKLFESHSILKYLAISRNCWNFYPQDVKIRARIDAYLDFHLTGMGPIVEFAMDFFMKPALMNIPAPDNKKEREQEVNDILNFFCSNFLQKGKYNYIGEAKSPSIADIRAIIDISKLFVGNFDFERFPVLKNYIQRMFKFQEIVQAQKEFIGIVKQLNKQFTPFNQEIIASNKKKGCC